MFILGRKTYPGQEWDSYLTQVLVKSVTWLLGVTQDYIWLYRMENTNKTGFNKVEVTFISPLVW